jgi:hypothetical protein
MSGPGHVTCDRDIEGLVGEYHPRDIRPDQPFDEGGISGVPADQAMRAEQELITCLCGCREISQRSEIANIIPIFADDDLVDLVGTEAGNLDWRVGNDQLREFCLQFANVPEALFYQGIDG